jgi:predicted permease
LLGHRFTAGNEQPGRGQVAVLSYALWQKIFGGDPQAIGKTFRLDSRIYRVIGVMPKSFAFPDRTTDLWVPVTITPGDLSANRLITLNYQFIGRLKDGATLTAVAQQLKSVRRFVKQSAGADWRDLQNIGFAMTARPFHQVLLGDRTAILLLLQGAVLLVLLITCANVANLLLARTLGRTHELAMRMALGANWARLARQLLVEGLCLAVPGGLAGVALGWLALRFVGDSGLVAAGEVFGVTPDWRVGLFALAVVCATGVLVSLLPIFHLSQTELQTLLQEGNRSMSSGRHSRRIRNTLVMTELALATALLAGAGLLLHSFANLEAVNPGFNKDHVLITGLLVPREDHRSDAALSNFYAGLLTRVRQLPGVEQAGIATHAPFSAWVPVINLKVRGYRSAPGVAPPTAAQVFVGGAFFKALGIPILRGRAFNSRDTAKSQPVAIINQQLAKRYFGDKNPIGKRIRSSYPFQWYTIVGVVPTVKTKRLDKKQTFNMLYLSAAQHPDRTMRLIVKTATPPNLLTKPLKELVEKTD